MGNNNSTRQYTYQQYYKALVKKNKDYDFSKINLELLDPYEVLEIPKNFTFEQFFDTFHCSNLDISKFFQMLGVDKNLHIYWNKRPLF